MLLEVFLARIVVKINSREKYKSQANIPRYLQNLKCKTQANTKFESFDPFGCAPFYKLRVNTAGGMLPNRQWDSVGNSKACSFERAKELVNNLIDSIVISYALRYLDADGISGFGGLDGSIINLY